jgi:hypothetical protein
MADERVMRPVALGRRNWTFAGSDGGGLGAAVIYSLTESAKMNGLDPEAYPRHVIQRIADHLVKRSAELLLWNLKVIQPKLTRMALMARLRGCDCQLILRNLVQVGRHLLADVSGSSGGRAP